MATAAPIRPRKNHPTMEPMIQAAFRAGGMTVRGRRATSTIAQTTRPKEAAYTSSVGSAWIAATVIEPPPGACGGHPVSLVGRPSGRQTSPSSCHHSLVRYLRASCFTDDPIARDNFVLVRLQSTRCPIDEVFTRGRWIFTES